MIHSTWGPWFVHDEVEAANVTGLSIWYLGCNGIIIRSESVTVYIDPYFGEGNPPNTLRMIPIPMDPLDATMCDAVLVTHEHIDHMHPPSYGPLINDLGAKLYAPSASYKEPHYEGDLQAPLSDREQVEIGDTFDIGDLRVHVKPANDPDAVEPVSYVIEHEAGIIFHGGDSRPTAEFERVGEQFDIELGILAIGSVGVVDRFDQSGSRPTNWYMDENQAVTAANDLRLNRLLPSHYDMWSGLRVDPKGLHMHAASYRYPHVIEPAQIGDRLDLGEPGIVPHGHLNRG